jgi:hypothetical protein
MPKLIFDILTYWHAGSGRGRDVVLDAEVMRDGDGLPYLPGKTIKGLLKKAMKTAALARGEPQDQVMRLFGSDVPGTDEARDGDEQVQKLEEGRFRTTPGALWFGSATLPRTWADWIRSNRTKNGGEDVSAILSELFRTVASTAIDERGVAREHTLRVSEVAVPMTLSAPLRSLDPNLAEADWIPLVESALPYLRSLGVRRRRGYGRVKVTLDLSPGES